MSITTETPTFRGKTWRQLSADEWRQCRESDRETWHKMIEASESKPETPIPLEKLTYASPVAEPAPVKEPEDIGMTKEQVETLTSVTAKVVKEFVAEKTSGFASAAVVGKL